MSKKEDLGVKIGTEEEKFWTDVRKKCEDAIRTSKYDIEINEHLIILADTRIAEEKEKLK